MIYLLWNRGGSRRILPQPSPVNLRYTHTTLADIRNQLKARLNDYGYYWDEGELDYAIVESIRRLQAHTGYYKNKIKVDIVAQEPFYDLSDIVQTSIGSTVTNNDIVAQIQGCLLETNNGMVPWSGTSQFNLVQIVESIRSARNSFLALSGSVVEQFTANVNPSPDGRTNLPDSVIDIRHCAWINLSNGYSRLDRQDEFSVNSYLAGWEEDPGTPNSYSVSLSPPCSLQLMPAPDEKGVLEILATMNGYKFSSQEIVNLGIPDDYSWAVKYGALAEILSGDGQSRDLQRANYCRQIFNSGASMASTFPSVMGAQLEGIFLPITTLFELDQYMPSWRDIPGKPECVGLAGRNMLAFGPVPNIDYSVTLDVVCSVPVPNASGDFIQVGQEYIDPILTMAQHICCFKMGGKEFFDTMPLFREFLRCCESLNSKFKSDTFYSKELWSAANRESVVNLRRDSNIQVVEQPSAQLTEN